MARMLQVRNLPNDVHARLKERAAAERMSLSDYVARELTRMVAYRSNAEILEAARPLAGRVSRDEITATVRADRDA
ncbi:FitA-like ribbon-helix-helix domain-containing protein [Agromyces bauzanensis]|uniref:Antitoxin FitA-like ribbon-helix-helix domain-containing protein n=1 Tax=Agromyces bauzanensis TaxID=1308924 RepID=A0A917PEC4_9MICO|nr:hypothetical protein [Agromyces bauzanensis]GGJ73070.1 hypothetical protein GCM10011372_08790 [Agromyces bauzanensis]